MLCCPTMGKLQLYAITYILEIVIVYLQLKARKSANNAKFQLCPLPQNCHQICLKAWCISHSQVPSEVHLI